jgi:hypothetical protein
MAEKRTVPSSEKSPTTLAFSHVACYREDQDELLRACARRLKTTRQRGRVSLTCTDIHQVMLELGYRKLPKEALEIYDREHARKNPAHEDYTSSNERSYEACRVATKEEELKLKE